MSNAKSPISGAPLPRGKPFEAGNEAREAARRGGKASGEARRRKKTLREELLYLLEQKSTGRDGKKHTAQEAMSAALLKQAINGNTKAFELIRDTIGEKPTENVNVSAPDFSALDAAFAALGGDDA